MSSAPDTTAYDALNIPALAAGGSYLDPVSGAKIYKLTDTSFPFASNPASGHDYADGGDEISLPWSGTKRTIHVLRLGTGFDHAMIDFDPSSGVSNPRVLSGTMDPNRDLCLTFSNNPATPYYCYICNADATVRRFDFRDNSEVTGGGWPWASTGDVWLHQSRNDARFVILKTSTGSTVVYEPSTTTAKTHTDSNVDEPRMERDGRYVGLGMTTPNNGLNVYDWNTDTITWTYDPLTSATHTPFAHGANLRSIFLQSNWDGTPAPGVYATIDPAVAQSDTNIGGAIVGDLLHGSGNWVQNAGNGQWGLFGKYGSPIDPGSTYVGRGGMVFARISGGRYLLGHSYNTSNVYERFPFAKLSPDGRYALFTSNMNGQTRCDLFLAKVPTN
ncbi:MAG TPA: hypothetical protein VF910_00990 [Candidatus Bathyarchaeia archaeon]